jgi:hypothetical protein
MRVVWLVDRQCWWWNAWHVRTKTELHGRADTREDARNAMAVAISDWRGAADAVLRARTNPGDRKADPPTGERQ